MASRVFCFDVPLGWRDDAGAEGSDFCEDFSAVVRSGNDGLKALCAEEDASAGMAVRSETSMDVTLRRRSAKSVDNTVDE